MVKLRRRDKSDRTITLVGPARVEPPLTRVEGTIKIGAWLIVLVQVGPDEISKAVTEQLPGRRLGESLVAKGVVTDHDVTEALARQFGLEVANLSDFEPNPAAVAFIPEPTARKFGIVALDVADNDLVVVIADPTREGLDAILKEIPVETVHVMVATPADVDHVINLSYRMLSTVDAYVYRFQETEAAQRPAFEDNVRAAEGDDDAPIIQVVNRIVTQALRDRASDIHLEPTDKDLRIRYRIDGALKEVLRLPIAMGPPLVSRIKIMADMNIVERRRPQDGQFQMNIDGNDLDVRVATTATIFGEKAVLRLLDKSRTLLRLHDLGMTEVMSERFSSIVRAPFGMVVVCGPTGSGKTTTLYATLSEIIRDEINVTTIEDPVEYVFPGINQIQIHEQAGLSFATGLKSILRQDPDVILVGEMRDAETARIAVQSALTGHFVLSTVHATDTVSALFRLVEMGIERFLVTSSLAAVLSQRLVRKVCESCKASYTPRSDELAYFRKFLPESTRTVFVRGEGCSYCANTGYRERIGVYELLEVDELISQILVEGGTPSEARKAASANGMRSLVDGAIALIDEDVTTIEEVIRSVYQA